MACPEVIGLPTTQTPTTHRPRQYSHNRSPESYNDKDMDTEDQMQAGSGLGGARKARERRRLTCLKVVE